MNNKKYIINLVAEYDTMHKTSYMRLLENIEDITSRKSFLLHVTASVYPVCYHKNFVLQIWHRFLQKWLQPGGHIEANELPHVAVARECLEETGLTIDVENIKDKIPDSVDIHRIPANAKKNEPEHYHCDLCYIAYAHGHVVANKDEVDKIAWVPLKKVRISNKNIMQKLMIFK